MIAEADPKEKDIMTLLVMNLHLHGGEKITLSNIAGGTAYQILEEPPSGWQIVEQSGTTGKIPANGTAQASFTNEYVPGTATITLVAQKTLDGTAPPEGMFQFTLTDEDGEVQTAFNTSSGIVEFEQLIFRAPGTYTYTIREVRGGDTGISYDTKTVPVTITVEDDGHGIFTATSSLNGNIPVFENKTKPGKLVVSKQIDGSGTGNESFTFEITLRNQYGQSLDGINIVGNN